ncbi:MAG: hypothetical protein PHS44_07195 [Candidatus Dojkabacteria bacterium]|jgi:hypothetical protein|nr:hypothetical protein [Candidatus Dojkabacteria bacterium]
MGKKFILALFFLSILVFIVSELEKKKLPEQDVILDQTYNVPTQTEASNDAFTLEREGTTYEIIPKYEYDLHGLVVSAYSTDIWYDITHEHDPLNTKDLCVVWGENIRNGVYQKMKYRSGEFTCFFEFKSGADSSWYNKFDGASISNNHLLPANESVSKLIKEAQIGDQIHIRGQLIDYSIETSDGRTASRNTSTVRTDSGCEIIYTTEFEIVRKNREIYRIANQISKYSLIFIPIVAIVSGLSMERKAEIATNS